MSRTTPLSVRMTEDLAEDLAVLQRGGVDASAAVRHALRLVADGQRAAERIAAENQRRPQALSIPTGALYARRPTYDGPDKGV